MTYALCLVLISIGLYAVFVKKNVVKIVLGFMIIEYGINLLLMIIGFRYSADAPIIKPGTLIADIAAGTVDPVPQAIVASSIIIGLALLILMVALCIRLFERFGTFDITEMRRLKG